MSKRLTSKEFIDKVREVHGDKYDYSKTEYKGCLENVCIICPKHGEFWQLPNNHLKGSGCRQCMSERTRKRKTLSTEGFIEKAREVHGDEYDYSKTVYKGSHEKIVFTCPIHGDQEVIAQNHLRGCKCPRCVGKGKYTTETFIKAARKVHGDKYDYSKTEYKDSHTKICIICHEVDPDTGHEHGEFWQLPTNHLSGKGCMRCSKLAAREKYSDTKEQFIDKAMLVHGGKYDYSKIEYINARRKVRIICHKINPLTGKEHGEFLQTPADHLSGYGCPNCANNKKMDSYDFIIKAKAVHGDYYDYSNVEYINNRTEVEIICPHCGSFKQIPQVHLRGGGCPSCKNTSYLEAVIRKELNIYNPDIIFEEKKKFQWLRRKKPMHLDFYLPEFNVAIECQGGEHFIDNGDWSNLDGNIERDTLKRKLCKENGVKMYYYSELGLDYPYFVYEDKKKLIEDIRNNVIQEY